MLRLSPTIPSRIGFFAIRPFFIMSASCKEAEIIWYRGTQIYSLPGEISVRVCPKIGYPRNHNWGKPTSFRHNQICYVVDFIKLYAIFHYIISPLYVTISPSYPHVMSWWFQTFFIFHFIYGMLSFPLSFIFFKMAKTTNQFFHLNIIL